MNFKEAVEVIQERIRELLNNEKVKALIVEKRLKENLTDEEAQGLITSLAIATLYGVEKRGL